MKKLLIPAIAMLALSQNVLAEPIFPGIGLMGSASSGTGAATKVLIKSIGIIAYIPYIPAGTMVIELKKDLQLGGNCNSNLVYIKKEIDSEGLMFALLKDAVNLQRSVDMLVVDVDDPEINPLKQGACTALFVRLNNP